MMDGVFWLACGFSCVWVYIFLGRLGFFLGSFWGLGSLVLVARVWCLLDRICRMWSCLYHSNMKFINSKLMVLLELCGVNTGGNR
jgi:hypothetical protein